MTRKEAIEVISKLKEMILHEDQFEENLTISQNLVIAEAIDIALIDINFSGAFLDHFIKKP